MNADTARSLIAGQKIKYWDDRIATVTSAYSAEPFPADVGIVFDADITDPKPIHYIKDNDFMRAEPI